MIPLPGGFHVDRTGLQGIVRTSLLGFGMKKLLKYSVLSHGNVAAFAKLSNWRNVRRVLHQLTTAIVFESIASLEEAEPQCRAALTSSASQPGTASSSATDNESVVREFLEESDVLWEKEAVGAEVIKSGKLFMDRIKYSLKLYLILSMTCAPRLFLPDFPPRKPIAYAFPVCVF